MAQEKENDSSQLLSHLKGLVKQYLVYDTSARVIASYVAPLHTKPGQPCVETRYGFRSSTSSDIAVRKERNAIWDPDNQNWDDEALLASLPNPLVSPTFS